MSKLEVVKVKAYGKDGSVNDFLYSVRGDLDHMALIDILGLDVVHVESQIIGDKHVTIINFEYQITTNFNKIFCPINLEDDDYVELKFNDKTFKVYRHFSYIGVTKSKTHDMLVERIYLIRKEMTQIRKMMPELETEVAVEVTVNGKSKKINTLVSKEESQNIIDQIFKGSSIN